MDVPLLADELSTDSLEEINLEEERERLYASNDVNQAYKHLDTIDWLSDTAESYRRIGKNRENYIQASLFEKIQILLGYTKGWLLTFFVGIQIGLMFFLVKVSVEWLGDLKYGYCPRNVLLDRDKCCWVDENFVVDSSHCYEWVYWTEEATTVWNTICTNLYRAFFSIGLPAIAAIMIREIAPYASNSGITEVKTILSGFIMHGFFGAGTFVVKLFSVILACSSGLVTSYEEAIVHLGGCISNVYCRMFEMYRSNEAKKREILSAGVAASMGVAFNAPIAGLLFSIEEVGYYFNFKTFWRAFFCVTTAVFILKLIYPENPLVSTVPISYISVYHMVLFGILSAVNGIFGALFSSILAKYSYFRKNSFISKHPIIEVVTIASVTYIIFNSNGITLSEHQMIRQFLESCSDLSKTSWLCPEAMEEKSKNSTINSQFFADRMTIISHLIEIMALKMVLCIFTIPTKLPTGFFVPCLVIGASFGRCIGISFEMIIWKMSNSWREQICSNYTEKCVEPAVFAIVGAVSFLSAVTQMSVTLVVMMAEATGTMTHIVPIMLAVFFSKYFRGLISSRSIFQNQIKLNKYPLLDNSFEYTGNDSVKNVVEYVMNNLSTRNNGSNLTCLQDKETTYKDVVHILESTSYHGFPIVSNEKRLIGYVSRSDLLNSIGILKNQSTEQIDGNIKLHFEKASDEHSHSSSEDLKYLLLPEIKITSPLRVLENMEVFTLVEMFRSVGIRFVIVLSGEFVTGIVTKKDLLHYLDNHPVT